MKMGETPIQAANSAIRLAHIIYKAGVNGFNPTHELRELLTTADLKGGAFFTNTLHEYIRTTVEWKMDKKGIRSGGDPEGEWNTWIEVAEEKFKLIRGRGDEVDRRIHEELKNRKALTPMEVVCTNPTLRACPLRLRPLGQIPHQTPLGHVMTKITRITRMANTIANSTAVIQHTPRVIVKC
jgi:hypothetical protein